MKKILQTISKNYRILFKNKISLFILLLGPIFLIGLIGFFYFNSNSFSISLGIYSPDDSEFNNFFKEKIEESQFSILYYNSKSECESSIKSGLTHGCIFLPENFKIIDNSENAIILKLDTSRGDIVAVTQNLITDQISEISREVQIENTKKLLTLLDSSEELVNGNENTFNNINLQINNLKNSNSQIKVENSRVEELFNPQSLGVNELASKYKSLNVTLNSKANSALSQLNSSLVDLEDAKEKLDSINGSSDASDAKSSVNKARSDIESAESNIEGLKNLYFLRQLGSIVGNVEDKLGDASSSAGDISWKVNSKIDDNSNKLKNISSVLAAATKQGKDYTNSIAALESKDAQTLMTPISVKVENLFSNSQVHLTSLFPSLIVGLIFIISLIMSSMFILTERKTKAHFRNFMSSNSAFNFLLGDFLSLFSIISIQATLIISLYYFWFLKQINLIFLELVLMVMPIIAIFVLIGMTIGYLTKTESSNVILTFLVILGLLSFSGKIIPLEALSKPVMEIALKNPLLISEGMVRKFLLFESPISKLAPDYILLLFYSLIFFMLNFVFESFSKKRFIYSLFSNLFLYLRNKYLVKTLQYDLYDIKQESQTNQEENK